MSTQTVEVATPYTQLCVWQGTELGKHTPQDFEAWIAETFNGTRIKFSEAITTSSGRVDLFFWVHSEDIPKFAVPRLAYEIRWWEDVLGNGGSEYSNETYRKYPRTW